MAAPHYTPTGTPASGAKGQSSAMRTEFTAIETGIQAMNAIPFVVNFDDFNTAASKFVAIPWAGNIVGAYAVNEAANTTTATVLTLEIATVVVTQPTWEWGSTDALDTVIASVPSALNAVAAGGSVEIVTDGGGDSVMPGSVTLLIERT